jgi:Phage portal protein, SPP1 Gp6-like
MLFQSQVPQVLNKMGMTLYNSANQARKVETAKRLNFYHDEQLERLNEQLAELFSEPDKMVKLELNIIKKIINNLAQVYREPPTRTLENGGETNQKLYAEILEGCSFDVKLKQASRYAKLLKTILIKVVWRNEKIDLDILTGNLLDVQTASSPEQLERVLITDYGQSEKPEDVEYSLWTAETWQRLNWKGDILEEAENPYKVLPFIPVFDYMPPSSAFWLPGGSDIISLQEAINIKLTDLIYLIQQQSFGVGYIKGSQTGGSLRTDPGSLVELPENGEIGFKSQQAKIDEVVNAIDKLIKWGAVSNGLSAASMSTDVQKQSGVSKAWDNKELSEMRLDDLALWRSYEKQLFNLMRVVWNVHSKKKLSEKAILKIDFAELTAKLDGKTQAESDDLKIAQGVLSPVDIAMRENPDFESRENALAHLLQIKEEQKQLLE